MPAAHLAGVLLVVVEVFRRERPAFVAEQTVCGNLGRVELQLEFHVFRHRHHRTAEFRHQDLLRLEDAVEERVVPVAGVRELLHHRVMVVAAADAEDRQGHARLALRRDVPLHTPVSRFAAMYRSSSEGLRMPTLKSPSVTSTTRLFFFAEKFFIACS